MNFNRFTDKTILITGAGSGIGRETAHQFANEGALVIGLDLNQSGLEGTKKIISKTGGKFESISADVSCEDSVSAAFKQALEVSPRIDAAFNNAGITQSATLAGDIDFDEWSRVLSVNVTGVWLCMREELRAMQASGGGSIVNTGSFLSMHSMIQQSAYTASKHAVLGLTKNAAIDKI